MSEQDRKSEGTGTPMLVEQTNGRQKAPSRPNDIQDETDQHKKHSRPLAVQSVIKEITKDRADDVESENEENKDQKRVKSDEVSKQSATRKLSPVSKKHGEPQGSIALDHVEQLVDHADTKKGSMPIPQEVEALSEANFGEKESSHKGETDSITDEIRVRTVDTSKKDSYWDASPKGNQITWEENQLGKEVMPEIDTKSQAWILERRASVGPCYRPGMPFEGPTGISIHIPRKSMSAVRSSGININMSRRNLNSRSRINIKRQKSKDANEFEETDPKQKNDCDTNFLSTLKEKLSIIRSKMSSVFNC